MKKIFSIFMIMIMVLITGTIFVYADQPYRGDAKHKPSLRDASISRADDTYEDRNGNTRDADPNKAVISFTSDMEKDLDMYKKVGTYQQIMNGHYPRSFMLDGGNFSDVSPYNMIFGQYAPGVRIMGAAGYDIAGIGTSELKQGSDKMVDMLNRAVATEEVLPYLTIANVRGTEAYEGALRKYGVNDYLDMNKYRTEIAVFSVIGKEAFDSAAPSKLKYNSATDTAKDVVREIEEDEEADIVVCFVVSGIGDEDTEKTLEKEIAREAKGIDIIISVGSTTEITKPIKIGTTRIVGVAQGSSKIGRIEYDIRDNDYYFSNYRTQELGGEYKDKGSVRRIMDDLKNKADRNFYAANGFTAGQVLAENFFDIQSIQANEGNSQDSPLGELVADGYRHGAIELAKIPKGNLIGISSDLSSEDGIPKGPVSVNKIYEMMALGQASDGTKGQALTSFYLKGTDVKKLLEIAATAFQTQGKNRLYFSGIKFKYNPHRFKDSRIYDLAVTGDDPSIEIKLDDETVYRFVTDQATAEVVKTMRGGTNNELSVVLVDEDGNPSPDSTELSQSGNEKPLKAWAACADYLSTFKEAGISASYKEPDGRMVYDESTSPGKVYKGEFFTLLTMFFIALVGMIALVILVLLIMNMAGVKSVKLPEFKKKKQK